MPFPTFEAFVKEWLTEENIANSLHFQHQHVFLEDEQGRIAVDFIGRFETIEADFKRITHRLQIKRSLQKTNTSKRNKNYKEYYTSETEKIVSAVYKRDIQLFNYEF